jgi:ATP-dependent RNA helicase RhlE
MVGGAERAKLRDIARLIRRTLPLENSPANLGPITEEAAPARRTNARPSHRPNTPRPDSHRRPANPRAAVPAHLDFPALAGKPDANRPTGAKPGKPRWSGKRKSAAKAAPRGAVRFGG